MITKYESFRNPFHLNEGIKAGLDREDFSLVFGTAIFESHGDKSLLEKSYCVYELGLLYENRREWFANESPIYRLESEGHQILFKGGNLFIITNESFRLLNEGFWEEADSAWSSIKDTASSAAKKVSSSAYDKWNTLSDGAKKAWEFAKRITLAAGEFIKEDPLASAAIFLQLLSGIVAFIPEAGQAAGPIMLGIAGSLEVYMGSKKMIKAWDKFSEIEVSKTAKAGKSFSEGAPLLIAGIVSMLLGLNDVITAPKAAIPAVGATSKVLHSAGDKWAANFAGSLVKNSEHFIVNVSGKAAGKIGTALSGPVTTFMGKGGSGLACTALSTLVVKTGSGVLGSFFDVIMKAIEKLAEAFSFVLSLPTKASEAMEKLIKAADSPIAKILITPLKSIINPVVKFLGKMIDSYIKPFVDGAAKFFETLHKESKALKEYADKIKVESSEQLVKKQIGITKKISIDVSKEDVNKIKKLPEIKESLKIKRFESFRTV